MIVCAFNYFCSKIQIYTAMFGIESKHNPIKGDFAKAIVNVIAGKECKGKIKPSKKSKKHILDYDEIVLE